MNPHRYKCVCQLCGGKGLAHVHDSGVDWLGFAFVHKNPEVCFGNIAAYLADRKDRKTRPVQSQD